MQPARQDLPVIPGATYRDTIRIMQSVWVYRDITAISGSPAVFTVPGHSLESTWPVWVRGVQGMPDANREPDRQLPHTAKLLTASSLEINALSAAGLRPAGGQLIYRSPVDLAGAAVEMTIWRGDEPVLVLTQNAGLSFTAPGTIERVITDEQTALLIGEDLTYTLDITFVGPTVTRYFIGAVGGPSSGCRGDGAIVTAGEQGPPGVGIPGPAGGSALQRTAGETLSALRAVYELHGQVFLLDQADAIHIDFLLGITLNAADISTPVNVQRSGVLDDVSWNWLPGRVWLGAQGLLTQIPPTSGFDLLIGTAVSPTRITLNLQDPIELEE